MAIIAQARDESDTDINARVCESRQKYREGAWRAPLFCKLILNDLDSFGGAANVLDIGCGNGFDGSRSLQEEIGSAAAYFCGVEPDPDMRSPQCFDKVHSCRLECAELQPASFDLAYAAFVLEHISEPKQFWASVGRLLKPGGVFWGFTMDSRHYFTWASQFLEVVGVKDRYLQLLSGTNRYSNYQTFYRCNSPATLRKSCKEFSNVQSWSWGRTGQVESYLPRRLRFVARSADKLESALGLPGSLLIVRIVR